MSEKRIPVTLDAVRQYCEEITDGDFKELFRKWVAAVPEGSSLFRFVRQLGGSGTGGYLCVDPQGRESYFGCSAWLSVIED